MRSPSRRLAMMAVLLMAGGCGTAVFEHRIEVVPLNGAGAETQVGVFDHQAGYSRDWAHAKLGSSTRATPYVTTISTTATVTVADRNKARPLRIALAVPEITDQGYFLLAIEKPLAASPQQATYCPYGEYFASAGAPTIPIVATAKPAEGGVWHVELNVDVAAGRAAMAPAR